MSGSADAAPPELFAGTVGGISPPRRAAGPRSAGRVHLEEAREGGALSDPGRASGGGDESFGACGEFAVVDRQVEVGQVVEGVAEQGEQGLDLVDAGGRCGLVAVLGEQV